MIWLTCCDIVCRTIFHIGINALSPFIHHARMVRGRLGIIRSSRTGIEVTGMGGESAITGLGWGMSEQSCLSNMSWKTESTFALVNAWHVGRWESSQPINLWFSARADLYFLQPLLSWKFTSPLFKTYHEPHLRDKDFN